MLLYAPYLSFFAEEGLVYSVLPGILRHQGRLVDDLYMCCSALVALTPAWALA